MSYITVTYNSSRDIFDLLMSLKQILKQNDEVIIVDNASIDGTLEIVEKFRKMLTYGAQLSVVKNLENIGYGKANNEGARIAKGDFLIFINPDCYFNSQNIQKWINSVFLKSTGLLAPLVRYPNGAVQPNQGGSASLLTYILQFFKLGARLRKLNLVSQLKRWPIIIKILSMNSSVNGFLSNYNSDPIRSNVDWVSGAMIIIRKSLFESLNGFDSNFFLYCEDEDLCRRIRNLGLIILFDPGFEIIHKVEASKDYRYYSKGQLERFKSNIYYLYKWNGFFSAFVLNIFYLSSFIFRCLASVFTLNIEKLKANLKYFFGLMFFEFRKKI